MIHPGRPRSLGQVEHPQILQQIRDLAKTIRDNRALLAEAFQKFAETNDPSWDAKVKEYDAKVFQLVQQAKSMLPALTTQEQAVAQDMISNNFNPSLGSRRSMGQAAAPAAPAAAPAPPPGVVCRPTAEGGQVCSDGTCFAPGGAAPVPATAAPSTFPLVPVAIGGGLAAIGAALWYFLSKK